MKFEKEKGKLHSEMDILGIAYKPDGSVARRFSDTVKLEFENKKEVETFSEKPYHYENQFDIAPRPIPAQSGFQLGRRKLRQDREATDSGGLRWPEIRLSALAFSTNYRAASSIGADLDALLIEDRTPLVTQGVQMIPAGSNRFKTTDKPAIYLEVYEPILAAAEPPKEIAIALAGQGNGHEDR